jgi:hypothetical protein
MGLFPNFFKNEEEMSAFNFKAIQNDVDDGNEKQWDVEYSFNFAELVMHFIVVFNTISPMLLILHTHTLKTFYSEFIRSWFPTRTTSVLHATVQDPFNVETVKLIFELGADPNAIYQNGRTPLHLLAGIDDINWELNVSMFKTLVDAGTHLDMAADDGETVLDVLKRNVAPPKASKSTRFYIRYPVPCSLCLVTVHELSVSREFGTTNFVSFYR